MKANVACFCRSMLAGLLAVAGGAQAAPSLPVTMPPVLPFPSYTGPANDMHAVSGQWFRVMGSETVTVRSHEFHDNVQGLGGGFAGTLAISGRVVNVSFVPLSAMIAGFDIAASVINDTPGSGIWNNGTNSHGEFQTATQPATGTLLRVVLTADFAMTDPTNKPGNITLPYRYLDPPIVATNMDRVAWYCWTPGGPYLSAGGFYVPGWHFGNIPPGATATRVLNFVIPGGLPAGPGRYEAIMQSWTEGTDILLNRSRSLKVSNWVDDLGVDTGLPDQAPPLIASDVSVFHDIEAPTNPPDTEPELCAKWSQPPDCPNGLDIESWGWGIAPEFHSIHRVSDDWLCDGRPITGLRWWGSYVGWGADNNHPDLAPPVFPLHPVAFLVMWHKDIPAAAPEEPFSRPGDVIRWAVYETALDFGQAQTPGIVWEKPYCVSALNFIAPGVYEHEYLYALEFPATNVWNEKQGDIYWLSVQAVYVNPPATNVWGWKNTPPAFNWNDDAVLVSPAGQTNEMIYPPPGWQSYPDHPYAGQSVNMAFELLTDVCPRRSRKWAQPPDMAMGENMASYWVQGSPPLGKPLRADDWLCDGRRVTDIHWWGSYLNYLTTEPGPVPPPIDPVYRPIGFNLSWHTDIPAGPSPSQPGMLLTNLYVSISNCHEVYYGTVLQGWKVPPPAFEHEFQYYVDLLNPDVGLPWMETTGQVYWLNIQAVFPEGFEQGGGTGPGTHTGWGWKTTPITNRWNDASVVSSNGPAGPWIPGVYPEGHPHSPLYTNCDLAFELTTDEVGGGTNWWNPPIVIRDIRKPVGSGSMVASVGDVGAGVQVLQAATNLVASNWVNVVTNALPLTAPYTNFWSDIPAAETTKFYRIIQK